MRNPNPYALRDDTPATRSPGGGRDRTDDLLLAKQALSQLSYAPKTQATRGTQAIHTASHSMGTAAAWWAREDSNLRPHAYQACALTN